MPQHKHHWKDALRHKGVIITLIVVGLIAAWGIGSRVMASFGLRHDTEDQAIPHVAVINAARGPSSEEIVLPGNVQAWHEAPIFARTSGYLKDWKTDIGSPVKAGDLLAEIETPEVDAQFHQAQADLATAEANNQLAQITAKRWGELAKSDSVSKQEVDAKISDAQAKTAMVASAKANLDHLSQLEGFKQVVAPFDGVITARNTDIGALINAGSNTAGTELFRIADTGKLRVYVQVPQSYSPAITSGLTAELHFTEHPKQTYTATLVRTAQALDPTARTLLSEFEVDNSKNELLPGGYTDVHIKLAPSPDSVRLPVATLIFRADGIQIATIDATGHAVLKKIELGRDFGKEVEITSGVAPDEQIIINPPDSLIAGQPVKIITTAEQEAAKKPESKKEQKAEKKEEKEKKA